MEPQHGSKHVQISHVHFRNNTWHHATSQLLKKIKISITKYALVNILKNKCHFDTHSSFHLLISSIKRCRPMTWRVNFCSFQSFCSTTVWVAIPAWSTPGTHSVTWPHIRCLTQSTVNCATSQFVSDPPSYSPINTILTLKMSKPFWLSFFNHQASQF